jgi:hypothetical protein
MNSRQNILFEVSKENFGLAMRKEAYWSLLHMLLLSQRKKIVSNLSNHALFGSSKPLFLAGKAWSMEKLANRLEESAEIIKSVFR